MQSIKKWGRVGAWFVKPRGLFWGPRGDSERFYQFFAENLTENDLMGGKTSPTLKQNLSLD